MTVERRTLGTEVRAEARRLSGTILRFGEVSPTHRERFLPGSIRLAEAVHLDLHHDREKAVAWHPGGGLSLSSDERAVTMRAELPPIPAADRALEEVRSGRATGLSVEFHAMRESRDGDIRVVEDAVLSGIGIVRTPSYEASRVEARARSGRTLRAEIPTDRPVDCACAGGGCSRSEILGEAMAGMWKDVFTEGTKRVASGYLENYSTPIASTARGTLRGRISGIGGYEVEMDIPDSLAGRSLIDAWESSGIIVRPFVDEIQGEIVDGVQRIRSGRLRAFIATSTDQRGGWPDPEMVSTPEELVERSAPPRTRRRSWVWL